MPVLYLYIFALSVLSSILVGYDKYAAQSKKRRIAEKTLLFWAFLGGSLGTGCALWVFKHKTSKASFLWKFYSIVVLQILIVGFILKNKIQVISLVY